MFLLFGGDKPKKWDKMEHNGPLFPPLYEPHNIPVIYKGDKIQLSAAAEEIATIYAKLSENPIIENKTFRTNFWNDWQKILKKDTPIKNLDDCNFSLIYKDYLENKEILANLSKEEKEEIKEKKAKIEEKYAYCYIDGNKVKVGNFRIEPTGIFMGRGTHPKIGKIKPIIQPEDVTINISKDVKVPEPSLSGHKWKEVIHDNTAVWLASWKDHISGKTKYVFTSNESEFKSKSDEKKFDRARKLKEIIKRVHLNNNKNLESEDLKTKQLATALYFIDTLALRVGSQKNKKKSADTVGVTSLRVEHIKLADDNIIKLDFLGKDSIRYCNKVRVTPIVYKNLEDFMKDKSNKDQLFDLISSQTMNDYLKSYMNKLTAKVFRTYNASETFQKELAKVEKDKLKKLSEQERVNILTNLINQANAEVAILCNHQKAVSKSFSSQLDKMDEQIKKTKATLKKTKTSNSKNKKERINKLQQKIKLIRLKKQTKEKMKNVSLGTSKDNYIDPRILVAFSKKYNVPLDKIFTKTSLTRFDWAKNTDENYVF